MATRIGIIGAGPNAAGHARYYAASERARVVAVADIDLPRAQALARECGARAVADYREFLDDVDAVVVSSPNFLHHEHALAVAAAGRHLYCEKPMGLNLAQARAIAAAVREAGVCSTVGFATRFDNSIQTLLRYVREGRLGRVESVFSRRLCYMDPAKGVGWRRDHMRSGGVLLEINIHELDWMMAVGGDVARVYARMAAPPEAGPRGNDHVWFTLTFTEGAVGNHEGSWLSSAVSFYRGCSGTGGAAMTNEWGQGLLYAPAGQNRAEVPLDPPFDLRGNFLDAIEGVAEPVADVAWGLRVMAVAEAIFESAATGRAVEVRKPAPSGALVSA